MTSTPLPEALPVRYRVSGMDCAKDAAQIERAAQTVGIAPDAVKVSAATHIMTLRVPEARLHEVEAAVATTGYGFDRIEGDEDVQPGAAHQNPDYRRALWIVDFWRGHKRSKRMRSTLLATASSRFLDCSPSVGALRGGLDPR